MGVNTTLYYLVPGSIPGDGILFQISGSDPVTVKSTEKILFTVPRIR